MSDTAIIYVVLAIIIVAAILWARSRVKIKLPGGIEASVDPDKTGSVSVAEDVTFENAEVGDVTGERRAGGAAARDVRVMNGSVVRGGKIDNISGIVDTGSHASQESGTGKADK